jgi:cytochrome c-type biogenesis protein CcmH/NrfF
MVLLWLAVPLAVVVVVCIVLWYRERRPTSVSSSVMEFSRELDALSPEKRRRPTGPRPGE